MRRRLAWLFGGCVVLWGGVASAQDVQFCAERSAEHQRWNQERADVAAFTRSVDEIVTNGDEAAQAVLRATPEQLDGFIAGINQQLATARQAYAQTQGVEQSQLRILITYLQAMLDLCLDARARAEVGDGANANIARFRERATMVREMNAEYVRHVAILDEQIAANRRQFAAMDCERLLNPPPARVSGLAQIDINGPWVTNIGRMNFTQTGDVVRGTFEGGTIEGIMVGETLRGRWIQAGLGGPFRAAAACDTPYRNSVFWGLVRIRFDREDGEIGVISFGGVAGACADEPSALNLAGRRDGVSPNMSAN